MPWIVGIDEAGYGPNLGPFVMASVACRVPEEHTGANFWHLLRPVVRRHKEREDGRLLIEDSKVVYSATRGLKQLERGVLATLGSGLFREEPECLNGLTLAGWVDRFAATALLQLREECWYQGITPLPICPFGTELLHVQQRFQKHCELLPLLWGAARCVVVCPARFNSLLDRWKSKSSVLLVSLAELLSEYAKGDGSRLSEGPEGRCTQSTPVPLSPGETVCVFVDKHGGRNNYSEILKQIFPDGQVEIKQEGADLSAYQITGLQREIHIQFEPRADGNHLAVALASMLAKYLRELLMLEFNQFWRQHLPELEPTAGYPGDARRFMDAIWPVATKLGLTEDGLWRRK